jgi:thiopurine S-methyltransferase
MDHDFWHQRWDAQQIGFHQPSGHPMLARYWPSLALAPESRVLVPLCGKTPDLCWLAAAGHVVTGIELSQRAARDFFTEQNLTPEVDTLGAFERYRAAHGKGAIELLVGDFFAADTATLGVFDAFYDRAALIALPPAMRDDYVLHLERLLKPTAPGLLITLDYDQNEMKGPPFAVPEAEVRSHFEPAARVSRLHSADDLAGKEMLSNRRVRAAREHVYRIERG